MLHRMSNTLPPAGYDELQRSEFTRIFGRAMGVRMFIAPFVATTVLALAAIEPTPWRRALLIVVPVAMFTVSVIELRRYRRHGMGENAVELNLLVVALAQLLLSFATGGVESPLMPLMLPLAVVVGIAVPGTHLWIAGLQVAAPWLFAAAVALGAVPDFALHLFGGGARPGHADALVWTTAFVYSAMALAAHLLGRALRRVFDGMLRRALEANDALRHEQAEQSQSIVTLTGEIAHELKNPLSSVKGLAALLVQNVGEGKGAERLGVLRQEIDRMQGILDEFLNFSRPLLPLTVDGAELRALCNDVVALHEGLARERGVKLVVSGDAWVKCDARKVRQVVINLVQNALDASPRGGVVELQCVKDGETGAVLRVLDRGPGLDPNIVPRLFQPGATTKPKGTGVGLTFARSLARQHGGELALGNRDGGGCAAVLTLPAPKEAA